MTRRARAHTWHVKAQDWVQEPQESLCTMWGQPPSNAHTKPTKPWTLVHQRGTAGGRQLAPWARAPALHVEVWVTPRHCMILHSTSRSDLKYG